MGSFSPVKSLKFFLLFSWLLLVLCFCSNSNGEDDRERDDGDDDGSSFSSYTIDSFTFSHYLHHYDWTYIKVELPPWFTSATIEIVSNVNLELNMMNISHENEQPMVCVREGGPPLPDVYQNSSDQFDRFFNGSFHDYGDCYAHQQNMTLTFTNYQILPGDMYVGFFNGIGPVRTQSKMINRGSAYSFTAKVTVQGCRNEHVSGPYCNQNIRQLSCSETYIKGHHELQAHQSSLICKNHLNDTCQKDFEPKFYSLNIELAQEFIISARKIKLSGSDKLMGYLRYGAVSNENVHDFAFDLSDGPFIIQSPKSGMWYLLVQPVVGFLTLPRETCYSLEWRAINCPEDKAGNNCSWKMHFLKDYGSENSVVYLPYQGNMSLESRSFSLEPLLSKDNGSDFDWTYFRLYVMDGFSGTNLHIQLSSELSDQNINYELYVRYKGIPSISNYDYYYLNQTSNSHNGSMFKFYDSSKKSINFYLLYPKEGSWVLGVRHYRSAYHKTNMSVSMNSCPNQCSGHGKCIPRGNERSNYYACECDRNHGGFDCSIELVSRADQKLHAIALIASNTAALFPAFWALRQKAFAEWVIFTCSGLASGFYHSCDVGIKCFLVYSNIQFMDFWLSYMAVVSTFVFLTVVNESAKRTLHTVAWIVTALMAMTGPTEPRNMVLVPVIGAVGLIIGWSIEFLSTSESKSGSFRSHLYILVSYTCRWENLKKCFYNVIKGVYHKFRWWFVLAGFIALGVAAIGWKAKTNKTYWIWHSVWHVSIYTSSFFFLCSRAARKNVENYRMVEDQVSSVASPALSR